MRQLFTAAALIAGLLPATVHAEAVREFPGFHVCYAEVPASPRPGTAQQLVVVDAGYARYQPMPTAYSPLPGLATAIETRSWKTPQASRPEQTALIRHEPVYLSLSEPAMTRPGRNLLLRAKTCWNNR
jgi:hypothetical protein